MAVAAAASAGVGDDRVDDVRTCTSEAVTNAVQAHRRSELAVPIVVRTAVIEGDFVIEVGDSGPGVHAERVRPNTVALRDGGYGIPVMRALSDTFEMEPGGILDPNVGTTVRLAYQRKPSDQE